MALLPSYIALREGSAQSRKDRKMKRQILIIILPILVFALMACPGTMKGIDRYSGKRIYFSYEDQRFGSGEIQMTMPDGERFVGRIVDEPTVDTSKGYPNVYEFPGNTEIFLQGDRGGNMRCKFRLSDTIVGFRGGGYGLCETEDGRVIDMFPR
jgi:hypothetical protein